MSTQASSSSLDSSTNPTTTSTSATQPTQNTMPSPKPSAGSPTRKVRLVLISDTHNQTPKLPPGDILIHAGDLTNQGSYTELSKTIAWLDRQDFEAKIVIAGNHEVTLDSEFFEKNGGGKFKWPTPQNPDTCRQLLTSSKSITYLEHESATIFLPSSRTSLRVFGSPYTPGRRGWAFQYWGEEDAREVWCGKGGGDEIQGVDVVVTHGPAKGWVDWTGDGEGVDGGKEVHAGCEVLAQKVREVKPMMHVCGHVHGGRGGVRVRWGDGEDVEGADGGKEDVVEEWKDPGVGNKKISLLDLAGKKGRNIDWESTGKGRRVPEKVKRAMGWAENDGQPTDTQETLDLRSSLDEGALLIENEAGVETWRRTTGGALECRFKPRGDGDVGRSSEVDVDISQRNETAMINAAFLSPRIVGQTSTFNKPIVVDVELPVWQ